MAAGRATSTCARLSTAFFYLLWTGCQWQALPKDLPPKSTVHHYFKLWDWAGMLERIHHALYGAVREQAGREASPSAAIIDRRLADLGGTPFQSSPAEFTKLIADETDKWRNVIRSANIKML